MYIKTLLRIAPALALLVIAPLIAEFLLGDFNIRQIGFILVFIPQYGGGALLVRELTRRARRGWPTMLLLALAGLLGLEVAAVALFAVWSRRAGWGPVQALAAASGAILTYGWMSLRRLVVQGSTALGVPSTPVDVVGQAALLLLLLGLCYWAWHRLLR